MSGNESKHNGEKQEHGWVEHYRNIGQAYGIGSGSAKASNLSSWDAINVQLRKAKATISRLTDDR